MLINLSRLSVCALVIASLTACGGDSDAGPSSMSCEAVTTSTVNVPGLVVTSAAALPASGPASSAASYPAHCRVTGKINERTGIDGQSYAIGFDIRLPAGWNGKFFYSGDGGLDGEIGDPLGTTALGGSTNALQLGYAVASSDGGHAGASGLDGSFGQDPQARVDYGYNALGTLTPLAKMVIRRFYGSAPTRAYYSGCSKGGQSGLMAASRFADQFDGVIAGNPGMDLPKASIAQIWDIQRYASVDPGIANAFSPADLAFVASRVVARCDALDGATDGMVLDVAACQATFDFNADVPQCAGGATPNGTCLSAAQKTALAGVFAAPTDSLGSELYASRPWDPGLAGAGWTTWKTFLNPALGAIAMGNVWATPPEPTFAPFSPASMAYLANFQMDTALAGIYAQSPTFPESAMDFMAMPSPTNLSVLKAKGKLIVYHGTADPVFSSNYTRSWYDSLRAADPSAANYARLYLVPGMNHCGGGPSTDSFNAFASLVDWVERGVAPNSITASVAAGNTDKPSMWSASRSRPLCPYPQKTVLRPGATQLESADSFMCQ